MKSLGLKLACCLGLLLLSFPIESMAQCYKAVVFITSGVKKGKITTVVVGAVPYTSKNGVVSLLTGSTVAYLSGTKKKALAQASGQASAVSVNGDITGSFNKVVVSGDANFPTKAGLVPAHIVVTTARLKQKKVNKKGQSVLTGVTSALVTNSLTGKILYRQKPKKFSKIRLFRYQWESFSCLGGGTGGVKR